MRVNGEPNSAVPGCEGVVPGCPGIERRCRLLRSEGSTLFATLCARTTLTLLLTDRGYRQGIRVPRLTRNDRKQWVRYWRSVRTHPRIRENCRPHQPT